uniref:Putative ovule protein n=1 Tax=Solanum chacoense TaxID=4108 RepID=A0A0V0HDJ5_SOLCH
MIHNVCGNLNILLSIVTIYPRAPISKYTEAKTKKYLIQSYVSYCACQKYGTIPTKLEPIEPTM